MKIAIYGDSFGDDNGMWPHRFDNVGPGWPELLSKAGHQISNFCEGGASFFYSFLQFNSTHQDHDKIIFMVTNPGRLTIEIEDFSHLARSQKHHPSYDQVVRWKRELAKRKLHSRGLEQLTAIEQYFLLVKNDEYDQDCQWLMINSIKKIRPDVVIIPCFHNSIPNLSGKALCEVSHMESEHLCNAPYDSIHTMLHDTRVDARKSHMSEENNFIFYSKMLKFLSGEPVYIDVNDFAKPSQSIDHYWRLK